MKNIQFEKLMPKNYQLGIAGAAIALGVVGGVVCSALWRRMRPSGSAFVVQAYSKGLAEIALAEIALQKSTSINVRAFAQHMIEDHTKLNKELQLIAERKNLHLDDEAPLSNKAHSLLLKHKEGQSFDEAYAEHQVKSHKQTLALFQRAMKCKDINIRYFATISLNKLNSHLRMAEKLAKAIYEYRPIKSIQRKPADDFSASPSVARDTGSNPTHN